MSKDAVARELDVAQRALDERDPKHALEHLARALSEGPYDERAHAAFEAMAAQVDVLGHVEDLPYLGTQFLRALAFRRAGRDDEAVTTLARLATNFPERGFEAVLASWLLVLHHGGRTIGGDAAMAVTRVLATAGESTIGLHRLLPGEKALLEGYFALAEVLAQVSLLPVARAMAGGMLRRAGRLEEALAVLEPAAGARDHLALIQQALTWRVMGQGARSAAAFEVVAAQQPTDKAYVVEQARGWFVAGDPARAASLVADLPIRESDPEVARLHEACRGPVPADPVGFLDELRRDVVAPPVELPSDATANLFQQNREKVRPLASVKVAISGWESPSNRLLVALFATGTSDVGAASYDISGAALPVDPSTHRRGSAPPVWVREGRLLVPRAQAPDLELRRRIAAVGNGPTNARSLWERAAAAQIEAAPEAIVAAMLHPPADPEWLQTLPEGLFRHQAAAAFVLANLRAPWSEVRPHFESLVFGPVDWVSAAALLALVERARRDPESAGWTRALLADVVADLVPHGCEPRATALLNGLSTLPAASSEAIGQLRAWYREVFPEEFADEAPRPAPPEPPAEEPPPTPPLKVVEPAPEPVHAPAGKPAVPVWSWLVVAIVAALILFALLR